MVGVSAGPLSVLVQSSVRATPSYIMHIPKCENIHSITFSASDREIVCLREGGGRGRFGAPCLGRADAP